VKVVEAPVILQTPLTALASKPPAEAPLENGTDNKGFSDINSEVEVLPEPGSRLKMAAPVTVLDIKPSVAEKLKKVGITTTGILATMTATQLSAVVAGVGDTIAKRMVAQAREYHGLGLKQGSEIYEIQAARKKMSTGVTGLDKILGGGIETGVITEFYGAFRSGKTQICHQLSVMVQLPPEQGGLGKNCAWIDTEGTWYAERPLAIAENLGFDKKKVLDNIFVARTYNSEEQMALTNEVIEKLDELNIGLIIIDSLIAHFRGEYVGRGTLALRQQTIGNYLELLHRPIELAGVAVVMTNQVSANPDPYAVGGPVRPVGGHVVAHSTTHRIFLKGKKTTNSAEIIDSPVLPQDKCEFRIMPEGVADII